MNKKTLKDDLINSLGLNVQLFTGIFISDILRLRYKEDLSLNLVKSYLQYISESEFSFKYLPENPINSSRAVLLFPGWHTVVLITDEAKTAFLIGKDWTSYNLSKIIPEDISLKTLYIPEDLHISYYILSIAREIVIKSPNSAGFENFAVAACKIESIEETINDVIGFIYKYSLKSPAEINSYLQKYEEIAEQDSLIYSVSDEVDIFSSLIAKSQRMSEWINSKLKTSNVSIGSSIAKFDTLGVELNKNNPFELASSIDDRSSLNPSIISVDEIIEPTFVSSLLEMGAKKKTIIMQIEDKKESCHCGVCPMM
ncbi:hypothetical protein SteCoe_27593 [Stentor coeruleus]|uniref:Uncharacterized protein n=1 Tax=Stentor coeruleus TaxID=5963 RepID=A0A1R2BA69_9CILI|nr:hypothetical protein SteCoe_27593 [Stentor coeruleus]